MDNKIQILIAVIITAVVCIAGTYALVGDNNSNQTITATGSTTIQPVMSIFAEEYGKATGVTVNVSGGGSGVGKAAALAAKPGDALIGDMSTDLTQSDIKAGLVATAIGMDAVVIIVDKDAGITSLTIDQLAKIYHGDITNWNQITDTKTGLNGNNLKISPILREDGSGTKDCIDTIMTGSYSTLGISKDDMIKYEDSSGFAMQSSTGGMLSQAESVIGAIGYINLGDMAQCVNTMPVAIGNGTNQPVAPSAAAVMATGTGHYPISRTLNLVTNGSPNPVINSNANATVWAFMSWIMSEYGQKILVDKGGFVSLEFPALNP